jgi:hypothetical protein
VTVSTESALSEADKPVLSALSPLSTLFEGEIMGAFLVLSIQESK